MTNTTKNPGGWSAVRQQLATWEKPALLALLKDLYETAAENRDFIHARCQAGEGGGEALEKYRGKIVEQFFPARGYGKLKLGEARKAIRDYRKATGNLPGTVELLMTYVENGTSSPTSMGTLTSGSTAAWSRRWTNWPPCCAARRGRCIHSSASVWRNLAAVSRGIGWGLHDYIQDTVRALGEGLLSL